MRKTKSRIVGGAVVLTWIVLVGALLAKQRVHRAENIVGPLPRTLLEESWISIKYMGEKVGWGREKYTPIDGGYKIDGEARMAIKALGAKQSIYTTASAEVDNEFHLKKFDFLMESPAQSIRVDGEVEGKALNFRIHSPPDAAPDVRKIAMNEPVTLLDTAALYAARKDLEVGKKFTFPSFDPATMKLDEAVIEVVGREEIVNQGKKVNAWVIKTSFSGVDIKSWMDDDGRSLKTEAIAGFTSELTTKADALKIEGEPKADIVAQVAIPSGNIPNYRESTKLKVKLSGVANLDPAKFDGGVQTATSGPATREVTLTISVPRPGSGYDLPNRDPKLADFLKLEPLLEVNDPEIVAASRKIIGGEKNSIAAAKLLNDWLYANIQKKGTFSLPNATDVWRSKSGDCNEHTVLYTALARAAGLPTRMAAGVVYLDGAFYYHAWPEVWLSDETGWTPVEPTLNEFPGDATHVRMAIGQLADQLSISNYLGKLKIDVIEYEPK